MELTIIKVENTATDVTSTVNVCVCVCVKLYTYNFKNLYIDLYTLQLETFEIIPIPPCMSIGTSIKKQLQ